METQELSWRERGRLWARLGIRLALVALAWLLLMRVGLPLLSLLMPFVLALCAAWLLNPLVRTLHQRLGVSRKLTSILLILLILAVAGGLIVVFVWNIAQETAALAADWSSLERELSSTLDAINTFFQGVFTLLPEQVGQAAQEALNGLGEDLLTWASDTLPDLVAALAGGAAGLASSVPSFAVAAVVFLMGSYFITADYPRLRYLATHRLPGPVRNLLSEVRAAAVSAFGGYVKAEFILSVGVFFILLAGFLLIGQPYALLLAFLLAVLDFIPILGSGTVMVPWAVVDLVTRDVRHAVELMVIWGVVALFRRVGEPKVVGDQTGLSPILSLISIYVGMRLGGVLGMVLGPVVFMVVINIVRLGVFHNTLADLRLAAGDLWAFFRNRPADETNSKNV